MRKLTIYLVQKFVQNSAIVAEEDRIFYTEDDDETEEQIWERKKEARAHPTNQIPEFSFEQFATHKNNYHKLSTVQKISNINSLAIGQNKDIILQQLRLKILKKATPRPFSCRITDTIVTAPIRPADKLVTRQ